MAEVTIIPYEGKMTREDAIKILDNMYGDWRTDEEREALEVAMIALKSRPTGEWIEKHEGLFTCALCGNVSEEDTDFCPDCGARMRKEGDHGDQTGRGDDNT